MFCIKYFILAVILSGYQPFLAAQETDAKTILFMGNSLTAGYGLEPLQAFTSLIQNKIKNEGMSFKVVNAGLSGETTSSGLRRIDWLLKQRVDVLVIELGGNDGLRGITLNLTKQNLQDIIDKARAQYPNIRIILAGMEVPPNMGDTYAAEFRKMYPELSKKNNVSLIPFLLEGVGDRPELNQRDGIHPTAQGHVIIAETVWKFLKPVLKSLP
ncbi:arylesterase [bacterium]|nr:arylesterase [bacterium]